ncbi:Uncharacterised protein [Clostridium baratii]|uniref:hypothetical protein n=1 Tax=Clostridium baratii TaxID=1561 RepID=UPI0006C423B1|nr:hypothetical protein [Clostridium baratii]CUO91753.1 Uncharacterised protein [Clostridium baratii]
MDLNKYKVYSKIMYTDKFTIKRYIDTEDDDGSTREVLDPNPKLKDIPCRISKVKEDEQNLKQEDANKKSVKLKVFCSPDIEVYKGDLVIAERIINGKSVDIIKAIAGKPMKYSINQEFILIEDGEA